MLFTAYSVIVVHFIVPVSVLLIELKVSAIPARRLDINIPI